MAMAQARLDVVPCLSDNYAGLLIDEAAGTAVLIDAPEAAPIEAALARRGVRLDSVLITHTHPDHIDGLAALVARHRPRVLVPEGAPSPPPEASATVAGGDRLTLGAWSIEVIETPGHMPGHVAYAARGPGGEAVVFTGDCLFSLGCGRLSGDTAREMWRSLMRLRALGPDWTVVCGHEYSQANARFALSLTPDDADLLARAAAITAARAEGRPTVPFRLGDDIATNPFLRADDPAFAARLGLAGLEPWQVFAELRERKNRFR